MGIYYGTIITFLFYFAYTYFIYIVYVSTSLIIFCIVFNAELMPAFFVCLLIKRKTTTAMYVYILCPYCTEL